MADAEFLHEGFRRFQFGGRLARAEAGHADLGEAVGKPRRGGGFRADDDEIDLFAHGESGEFVGGVGLDGDGAAELGQARIAGRGDQFRNERALRELPAQRMLTPARTDDENLHGSDLWTGRGAGS